MTPLEIKPRVSVEGLIEVGFRLAWEENNKRCYNYKCSSIASVFFVFDEDGIVLRCGMTTSSGIIIPMDKNPYMADVLAVRNIFRVFQD